MMFLASKSLCMYILKLGDNQSSCPDTYPQGHRLHDHLTGLLSFGGLKKPQVVKISFYCAGATGDLRWSRLQALQVSIKLSHLHWSSGWISTNTFIFFEKGFIAIWIFSVWVLNLTPFQISRVVGHSNFVSVVDNRRTRQQQVYHEENIIQMNWKSS